MEKNKGKRPQCSGFHNFNLQLQGEVYNTVDASEIRRENQLRLVVYPIIYRGLYIQTVVVGDFWTTNQYSP